MSDAAEILVIILSVFLALFLLLGIILSIMLIRVVKNINSIAASVQHATEQFEGVVNNVSKATTPLLIAKMVLKQFQDAKKKDKK